MKIKSRLEKIEAAIEQMEQSGRPRFKSFFAGQEIPPPVKGTTYIIFQSPPPNPVPPELQ